MKKERKPSYYVYMMALWAIIANSMMDLSVLRMKIGEIILKTLKKKDIFYGIGSLISEISYF